ncbi:MAG: VanZ family protein [Anaerolineales bacterium]|nr:VanZ family protein [Anaerolineales bacterium]
MGPERGDHFTRRWPKADRRRSTLAYIIELLRRSRLARRWGPVFIWMAGIFYFSSRPDPLAFLPSSRRGIDIGNLAHIGEYAGLTALLHRALREQGSGGDFSPTPPHLCTLALISLAYAVLDELHQELVPGRDFELADIGHDLAGIIAALGLIWVRER